MSYPLTTACRDALSIGPPGLEFVAYGNSTSVTTGYSVAAGVPLVPCTTANNATVRLPFRLAWLAKVYSELHPATAKLQFSCIVTGGNGRLLAASQ